jgi:hypothetical protein
MLNTNIPYFESLGHFYREIDARIAKKMLDYQSDNQAFLH